jgi:two-component system OmpR family sensor kinase
MFRTLYARLGIVLLILFSLVGVLLVTIVRFSTNLYQQEVTQKLNLDLAAHAIAEKPLLQNRLVNQVALKGLFSSMMLINPSIEVYLLDAQGGILAYSAPPGKVQRQHVNLGPVKSLIAGAAALPILGDDPRNLGGSKIFSAAAIPDAQHVEGYLYIILGSQEYEGVMQMLAGSYILKLSASAIGASLLFALLAGLLLFSYLTRRLRGLSNTMDIFKHGDFTQAVAVPGNTSGRDEIDRLSSAFRDMMQRMVSQVHKLKDTDRLRRELVANVSHDLRTPLAALQGYLETVLLKSDTLDSAQQRQYIEIAARQSERLGRLVTELFELAKLDAQVTQLHAEPFSLAELIQDTVQRFALPAQDKAISIDVDYHEQLPFVRGDIGMIERVLVNLLENALRYTDHGGVIRLGLHTNADSVTVQVEDTGCGIPAEELPFIFDRCFRVERAGHADSQGAGLGLAIARRIVQLHGHDIRVESQTERGTTFVFDLPIRDKKVITPR